MKGKLKFASAIDKEIGVGAFLPYSGHVTQNIVKMMNGDMMFTIKLAGAAHQSADISDLNGWHLQLNGFIRNISSPHVALWSHIVRREINEYPEGEFKSEFIQNLNDKYRSRIEETTLMINELYISVLYRPQPIAAGRIVDMFATRTKAQIEEAQLEHIEIMEDLISTSMAALDRYNPELLGCYEFKGNLFSEVGEFLHYILNGEWHRFPCRARKCVTCCQRHARTSAKVAS